MGVQDRDWYHNGHDKLTGAKRRPRPGEPPPIPRMAVVATPTKPVTPTPARPARLAPEFEEQIAKPVGGTPPRPAPAPVASKPRRKASPAARAAMAASAFAVLAMLAVETGAIDKLLEQPSQDTMEFPPNGVARFAVMADPTATGVLSVTTPESAKPVRYAMGVHEWVTNEEVARTYLTGATTINLSLPPGRYRLMWATGRSWQGDDRLFGAETEVRETTDPIEIVDEGYRRTGYQMDLTPATFSDLEPTTTGRDAFNRRR